MPPKRISRLSSSESRLEVSLPSGCASRTESNTGSSKRVRGLTRGKNTSKIKANNGGRKLPVDVPANKRCPVGDNSTRLAIELGVQIRLRAPLQGVKSWWFIPDAMRESIIQATRDKFEIINYDVDSEVRLSIQRKCKDLYKDWKSKMKAHYDALVEDGVDPYTMPYGGVKQDDWVYMIDVAWKDEDFQNQSTINKESRAQLPYNHTMGSRSFSAAMSIEANKNGGEMPHIADFYKTSHWSKRKSDWIDPQCGILYDEFQRKREEASQPEGVQMTQEEMSIEVLGKRRGYLRGFGVGPKPTSSSRSTAMTQAHVEEIKELKEEIESLRGLNTRQDEKMEAQSKRIEELEQFMRQQAEFMKFMRGFAGGSSSSCGNFPGSS